LKKEGLGNTAIAKKLTGKYQTEQGLINWSDTQVRRILKSAV
jgi:ABC-type siderophore export system fused ATPase/permease subunit